MYLTVAVDLPNKSIYGWQWIKSNHLNFHLFPDHSVPYLLLRLFYVLKWNTSKINLIQNESLLSHNRVYNKTTNNSEIQIGIRSWRSILTYRTPWIRYNSNNMRDKVAKHYNRYLFFKCKSGSRENSFFFVLFFSFFWNYIHE